MNKLRKTLTISESKIQASILLKSLHTHDHENAKRAAKRLQRLPEFAALSLEQIIKAQVKHKHALAVIAIENGFKSWIDLKSQIPFIIGGYLNRWFASYAEAKSALQIEGGFLLPYKNQFFICESNYIKQLGLDPNDPDWRLINYDWAQPANKDAWQRLYRKWMQIIKETK